MAVDVADGALGIEAIHTWTPPSGSVSGGIPSFVLNDQAALATLDDYAVIVSSITGLHSLPDITDERDPSTGRPGELVYDSIASGKTVVYSGMVVGATLQDLRAACNAMRRAFGAQSRRGTQTGYGQPGEGRMQITPHPAYGAIEHYFSARALSLEIPDEQQATPNASPTPWQRTFVLTLRLADPRFYMSTEHDSLGHASGDSASVTNAGSAPTDPQFRVDVAGDSFTLARGTDVVLTFSGLPSTGWHSVDFRTRTCTRESDGADMTARLEVANSNWWDPGVYGLEAGANDVGVTGGDWELYWRDASW